MFFFPCKAEKNVLYYFQYYSDKTGEIDFVLQNGTEIIPIEAKGGEDKSPSFLTAPSASAGAGPVINDRVRRSCDFRSHGLRHDLRGGRSRGLLRGAHGRGGRIPHPGYKLRSRQGKLLQPDRPLRGRRHRGRYLHLQEPCALRRRCRRR